MDGMAEVSILLDLDNKKAAEINPAAFNFLKAAYFLAFLLFPFLAGGAFLIPEVET